MSQRHSPGMCLGVIYGLNKEFIQVVMESHKMEEF